MITFTLETVLYACAIGLVAIGAIGLVATNNLYRMVLSLVLIECGANLLLILSGYRAGGAAPIITGHDTLPMVDPVPQVLVLTAIVIAVGIQALAVAVLVRVYRAYGTLDIRVLRQRMEEDIATDAGIEPPSSQQVPHGQRPLSTLSLEELS